MKTTTLSVPLTFFPVYKDYVWGGGWIPARYHRVGAPNPCAESWEISAHPDGPSVVANGPFLGERLDQLVQRFGPALVGTRAPDASRFPLLFKLIDTKQSLSVQVHPNGKNAQATGGEPKTEMWVVLDHTPGASLYAGIAPGVTPEQLLRALGEGTITEKLVKLPAEMGATLFIPGGLVHAINAGCLIYEVQQNANTTYRLFDWNRIGNDGKPRQLHIDAALKAIDWTLSAPRLHRPVPAGRQGANQWFKLVSCPFFTVRELTLAAPLEIAQDGTTFHAWFMMEGRALLSAGGETVSLEAGASALVPAAVLSFRIAPSSGHPARLLATTL